MVHGGVTCCMWYAWCVWVVSGPLMTVNKTKREAKETFEYRMFENSLAEAMGVIEVYRL